MQEKLKSLPLHRTFERSNICIRRKKLNLWRKHWYPHDKVKSYNYEINYVLFDNAKS